MAVSLCIAQQPASDYVPGEALVVIRPENDDADVKNRLASVGEDVEQIATLHVHRLRLKSGMAVEKAVSLLQLRTDVVYAQPNHYYYGCATPNDPAYSGIDTTPGSPRYNQTFQWGPQQIQANLAWNIWQPKQPVYIAILDTGVDDTHPDLTNKMYRDSSGNVIGYNVGVFNYRTNDSVGTADDNGHGTFNAGIAAAQANNGVGIAGIAGWNSIAG